MSHFLVWHEGKGLFTTPESWGIETVPETGKALSFLFKGKGTSFSYHYQFSYPTTVPGQESPRGFYC